VRKVLLLGGATGMKKIIPSLLECNFEPIVVNTDPVRFFDKVPVLSFDIPVALNLYQGLKIPKLRVLRYFFIASAASAKWVSITPPIANLIKTNDLDFIFANWGTGVLPEVSIVKSMPESKNLPLILNMETFPTAYSSGLRQILENNIMRKTLSYLDALIVPTPEMLNLLFDLSPTIKEKTIYKRPMYYPSEFAPREILPLLSKVDGKPHIVFMGQFDRKYSLNDVRNEIISLAKEGIIVHCSNTARINHENVVPFKHFNGALFTPGVLTSFMTQFDACLVAYNFKENSNLVRFQTSFPARFLIALVAGIPVILPRGKFEAMENFVKREGIGYAFEDSRDAYLTLANQNWAEIIKKSKLKQKYFTFNSSEFLLFINNFLQNERH